MNLNNMTPHLKKLLAFGLANVFFTLPSYAQEAGTTVAKTGLSSLDISEVFYWLLAGFLLLVILLTLCYLLYASIQIERILDGKTQETATPIFQLTKSVPIEREHEILLDHDYDGIQELDNMLPPWWVALFYITIAFGGIYWWYYHIRGDGNIMEQEYKMELVQATEDLKLMANRVDETSVKLLTEPDKLKSGEAIFIKNCVACHGKLGEGGVGPNLTDAYWLHGGDIQSVFKTIKYGVPEKGMIPWQAQLSPSQIQEVASYIEKTLAGTNVPNGKAPQGELVAAKK
jgi:cytochrome c oxidase cbb3-type subunit 3